MLLYRDHDYYIRLDNYKTYLRRLYTTKDNILKRVIKTIRNLPSLSQLDVVWKSFLEAVFISRLIVISDYWYAINDYGLIIFDSRTIQHYQFKVYTIDFKKAHRRTESIIDVISFQFFFSKLFFHSFIVDYLRFFEQTSSVYISVSASREFIYSSSSRIENGLFLKKHYIRS